ncbi:UrcA family protein [Pontixanthobacter sp.]|uniref:UrcA family protein n=1 Tax=Pontixanthobacter sp. TaxID=2792078 RepID=UPI003C7D1659
MKKTCMSLAAMGLLTATTPVYAESIAIEYRDLNLATIQGQDVLERRIDRAARKVCGLGNRKSGTRIPSPEIRECYDQAKRQGSQQMATLVDDERLGG